VLIIENDVPNLAENEHNGKTKDDIKLNIKYTYCIFNNQQTKQLVQYVVIIKLIILMLRFAKINIFFFK